MIAHPISRLGRGLIGGGLTPPNVVGTFLGLGNGTMPVAFASTPIAGDVMHVLCATDRARAAPGGWALVDSYSSGSGSGTGVMRIYYWTLTAGGSESNSYVFGGTNAGVRCAAVNVRGAHSATYHETIHDPGVNPSTFGSIAVADDDFVLAAIRPNEIGSGSPTFALCDLTSAVSVAAAGIAQSVSAGAFAESATFPSGTPTRSAGALVHIGGA